MLVLPFKDLVRDFTDISFHFTVTCPDCLNKIEIVFNGKLPESYIVKCCDNSFDINRLILFRLDYCLPDELSISELLDTFVD